MDELAIGRDVRMSGTASEHIEGAGRQVLFFGHTGREEARVEERLTRQQASALKRALKGMIEL